MGSLCWVLGIISPRKRSLEQGNNFTGVCLSTRGGWVSLTETPWTETPLDRDPLDRDATGQNPPFGRERAVHMLLECILVYVLQRQNRLQFPSNKGLAILAFLLWTVCEKLFKLKIDINSGIPSISVASLFMQPFCDFL